MVVSAYRSRCPRWHTALLRFSEELGIGKERPEHASQEVRCVRNRGTGAGFGRQCLPGICPNPKRPRVVPGHRCFASVGRKLSLLPRRETFSGSGQTYPKTRAQTGSAKRERGNPYGERSGTRYCYELNGRLGVQPLPNAPKKDFSMHITMHNSVVYDALAVPSVLSHVVESNCDPLTLTAAV